eukprot:PhM_4_TR11018/c0_g1_i1/m.27921/K20347/TMED2, EMP24; p24 family protein beta-1
MTSMNSCFAALLVGSLLLLTISTETVRALTVKVNAQSTECFRQPLKKGQEYTFQYRVTAGGMQDIDASLIAERSGAHDDTLETWKGSTTGRHVYTAHDENVIVVACFNNEMARWTPKWVAFHVYLSLDPEMAQPHELTPLEQQTTDLHHTLERIRQQHDDLRLKERAHRDLVEATNSWVLYWSIFECVLLVAMGAFQVWYLKSFLEAASVVRGYI